MGAVAAGRDGPTLTQFVLKLHSRCNLKCDHCYVYEHADQGWINQPRSMALGTLRAAAKRIAEHAATHALPRVAVVLHGGEPLLVGPDHLRQSLALLRQVIEPTAQLGLGMQTNGLLLSEAVADILLEFDVTVGVSLDGDQVANDRHRIFADGASSYSGVLQALKLLRQPRYRRLYGGLLCTVDITNDPIAVYEALLAQRPPKVDLLLPHATWDQPPPRPNGDPAAYGSWLGKIHARWLADGKPMAIRFFDSLRSTADGGPSHSEWVGLDPVDLAVIETDGSWEQVDSLKTAYDGAAGTGLNVFTHTVDEVTAHPGIERRQQGLDDLCATCRACPLVVQCGGGLLVHRFRAGSDFDNPSVYCSDLKEIIGIVNTQASDPPSTEPEASAVPEDVLDQIAAGVGDAAVIGYLDDQQVAITRALLVAIAHELPEQAPGRAGWQLLSELDTRAPDVVRSVLAHPYIRVWAVGRLGGTGRAATDGTYLCRLAAAAAIRAGIEAELPVHVEAGRVVLPGVGTIALPGATDGPGRLTISAGELRLRCGDESATVPVDAIGGLGTAPSWQPSHRVVADRLTVVVEDQDPYRDCHQWSADGQLSTPARQQWQESLHQAWQIVDRDAPDHVAGLIVGLRLIAPLIVDPGGKLRASTARHAFGAVAMAPAPAESAAVMLVHEFQHGKLGALLDLVDLYDPTYQPRIKVGWRDDLRPLEGVLQGTYAHLSVAQLWHRRAGRPGPQQAVAQEQYKTYADWTVEAIDSLVATKALTSTGDRFVAGMAKAMANLAG